MELHKTIETSKRYKLYVDLDGVLVDFDTFAEQATGIHPQRATTEPGLKSKFWRNVNAYIQKGNLFFGQMKPMPDAMQLWDHVKQYDPEILSATGHVINAAQEKAKWVNDHLGNHVVVNLVTKSNEKAKFAAPNHVLIDDRSKSIDPWVAAGGIGILHKNAVDTIQQLKQLGL